MEHSWVEIDGDIFRRNVQILLSMLSPSCQGCIVVKADAYGHGLRALAPIAVETGATFLGITENAEARIIRDMGLQCRIIRLRPAIPDEIEEAIPLQVEEIVGSMDMARSIEEIATKRSIQVPIHIAIDVGISRMSFSYPKQKDQIQKILLLSGLNVVGLMTHFPCADEESTQALCDQVKFFEHFKKLEGRGFPPSCISHLSNSAAALRYLPAHADMVRFGIACYGLQPSQHVSLPEGIEPVMCWKTRVALLRNIPKDTTIGYGMTYKAKNDMLIATLPLGYADAYLRSFSNQAEVLIHGKRCPVVGRISMDMVTVDVSHLQNIKVGDEVVLLGKQEQEEICADELAAYANTINYEMVCLIGKCNEHFNKL